MLSTSFTMASCQPEASHHNPFNPRTPRPERYSVGSCVESHWTPTYSDCDEVIRDIYTMTARSRRREPRRESTEGMMQGLRISEDAATVLRSVDKGWLPLSGLTNNISSIQKRPLHPPSFSIIGQPCRQQQQNGGNVYLRPSRY